jgi:Rps23 Pro-64 3,4-dihydroxylase Tpa1-like proline 4-hydroxylase
MRVVVSLSLILLCSCFGDNGKNKAFAFVHFLAQFRPSHGHGVSTTATTTTTCLGASKGFGKSSTGAGSTKEAKRRPARSTPSYTLDDGESIQQYLRPGLFEDPKILQDVGEKLRDGEIVVIRDAFVPEFAEGMYQELRDTTAWSRNEDYFDDGYHFRHYNVYDKKDFSSLFLSAIGMFDSDKTKEFLTELTGRDCTGEAVGAPSYYGPGDHSLPHTDHIGQRTIAFVWHLSKNWKPEWGGGLYWAQEPLANAYLHASFNSLVLFSVTPHSSHFVTTVSPHATEKRLAFNGWWQSSWIPNMNDPIEELLATPEQRMGVTHTQLLALQNILDDPWAPRIQPPERHGQIEKIRLHIMEELYPPQRSMPVN